MAEDDKPYGPVRYGPKSPEWAEKIRRGQKLRDDKFILAIQQESKRKGKIMSYEEAKRELAKQQRISQKEIMWQEHRSTLTETSPKGEAKERPSKVRFEKQISRPPESEIERLKRENDELKQLVESLKDSVEELTAQNRQMKRDLNK